MGIRNTEYLSSLDPDMSSETLDKMVDIHSDDIWKACYNVAMHLNTADVTLARLAQFDDYNIRYQVALNHNASATTLDILATDIMGFIRAAVARHPNTSVETLITLVNGVVDIQYIREAVSNNPKCPEAVRLWLKSDGYAGMSLADFLMATQETP